MNNSDILKIKESPAVQAHISMLQGIISRMAVNSSYCKNWTVTLVAALLVLLVDEDKNIPSAYICLIPVVLFYVLDSYYLGLERKYISMQKTFLKNLEGPVYAYGIFMVNRIGFFDKFCSFLKALFSFSTLPFYMIVTVVILFFDDII